MFALLYDPTISLGAILTTAVALLTVITLIIGMVSLSNRHAVDMALLKQGQNDSKTELANFKSESKSDAAALKSDVAAVAAKIEVLAVIQQKLADGKERMDNIDERLRAMEMTTLARRSSDKAS